MKVFVHSVLTGWRQVVFDPVHLVWCVGVSMCCPAPELRTFVFTLNLT